MTRTNVVVDEALVERVKRIYGVRSAREAIDLALRRLVGDLSDDPHAGFLELEGTGWHGDLDELRRPDPALESWLRAE
jgi:Arc/MetJ family transcription regulator